MTIDARFRASAKPAIRALRRRYATLSLLIGAVLSNPLHAQDAATADPAPGVAVSAGETAGTAPSFAEVLAALPEASYAEKEAAVARIITLADPRSRAVLAALLDGKLHALKSDGRCVIVVDDADAAQVKLINPLDGSALAPVADADLKKVGTNNRLRKVLKGAIAQLDLNNEDPDVRVNAVRELLRELDDATILALRARAAIEESSRVRQQIDVGLAISDLASDDAATRRQAVINLDGQISDEAYNALRDLSEKETEADIRSAALAVMRGIDNWRKVYGSVETLFFGMSLGSVLVLSAIGLAITFGVMGVINMAHGELMMIGAYTTYCIQLLLPDHIGLAMAISIPAAFLVSGAFGVAIERGIVRFLYGRPLETLLATFGLSLILQQLVRSIFSPLNRSVATPEFMSGQLYINDALSLTYNRLYIVVFALLVFALLQLLLRRTSLGLKIRAVSQNRAMSRAMGIRSEWIDAATFGLGAGIAGVAGVALSQLTNVGPNLGQAYIIDSFMVVVFGGVGNLWGTLISGMTLGVVNKLLEPYAGAVLAKILVLVALILFIQRKPRGLFPQKGRAAEGH